MNSHVIFLLLNAGFHSHKFQLVTGIFVSYISRLRVLSIADSEHIHIIFCVAYTYNQNQLFLFKELNVLYF